MARSSVRRVGPADPVDAVAGSGAASPAMRASTGPASASRMTGSLTATCTTRAPTATHATA